MREWKSRGAFLLLLTALVMGGCTDDTGNIPEQSESPAVPDVTGTFNGWTALTINNGYARLDIVPELGGKVMGYAPFGEQVLWHNPVHAGEVAIFTQNDLGQRFIDPGGAKVWPSPQQAWGGPPDRVLDGHPYEATFDGSVITVVGPADTGEGRTGLQYTHRYSLSPRSTFVNLSLGMTNRSTEPTEWGFRHLVTIPASTAGTVYVPVASDADWEVIDGDPAESSWLGVEGGIFRARCDGAMGTVGMTITDGWAAWHDETRDIAFVLLFQTDANTVYPHDGHQIEIHSTGAVTDGNGRNNPALANFKISVLSPLSELAPEEAATMDVQWAACRCSDVVKVAPHGIVAERLAFDGEFITGKLGTFITGTLVEFMYGTDGNQVAMQRLSHVSPTTEIVLRRDPVIPPTAAGIRYQVIDDDGAILGVLEDVKIR